MGKRLRRELNRTRWPLGAVFQFRVAIGAGAVDAAENFPLFFNAVTNNPAAAVRTGWRERVDRTFKAVEHVLLPVSH